MYYRRDEYWDAWRPPSKFCVVDKGLLDYLGYEGAYRHQREADLKNLRSNFRAGIDFIDEGRPKAALILGAERQSESVKILAVSYSCLLQWWMSVHTARGNEIRKPSIDSLLNDYGIARHGTKAKKIE